MTTEKIIGFLEETETKEGKTKKGRPWTLYKGNVGGKWVNFGFDRPPCKKGDYVTVTTEPDGDNYKILSITVGEPPARQPEPARNQAGAAAPAAAGSAAISPADRQSSIIYQSSRGHALELIGLLISQDALPVTAAKTAAGKAKRYEEIMALVDKLTVQYFYDVHTLRQLDRVADAGAEGPAPAALPEDDTPSAAEADAEAPARATDAADAKPAGDGGNW